MKQFREFHTVEEEFNPSRKHWKLFFFSHAVYGFNKSQTQYPWNINSGCVQPRSRPVCSDDDVRTMFSMLAPGMCGNNRRFLRTSRGDVWSLTQIKCSFCCLVANRKVKLKVSSVKALPPPPTHPPVTRCTGIEFSRKRFISAAAVTSAWTVSAAEKRFFIPKRTADYLQWHRHRCWVWEQELLLLLSR